MSNISPKQPDGMQSAVIELTESACQRENFSDALLFLSRHIPRFLMFVAKWIILQSQSSQTAALDGIIHLRGNGFGVATTMTQCALHARSSICHQNV
jgi:hypothetical protein